MKSGLFITFEGSEACGKTTQIERLAARLGKLGRAPLVTREPGGTAAGEVIRDLLQHSKSGQRLTPEAELLLFTASRAQLVREVIQPTLAMGQIVLSDRFLDSTTVYQGVARHIAVDAVAQANAFAVGNCLPHLTFLFDLEPEAALARLALRIGARDRMESQPLEFYAAVRQGYLELAALEKNRFVVLDAALPMDEIEQTIWNSISSRFDLQDR